MSEPNLNEPGKPEIIIIDDVPREVERTKFKCCQELMGEIGDRLPAAAELARWELTKAEYDTFLMDLHEDQVDLRERRAATKAAHERTTGRNLELPEVEKDRLGLEHLKGEPPSSQ